VGKKISHSSKKSTPKKRVGFKKLVLSPAFIVVGLVLVIISGYFAYETIHYYSAPAEIKLIRTLPIYDYESDNLKIVSRSEDYGGTDWKHVYNKPRIYINFDKQKANYRYTDCVVELTRYLVNDSWEKSEPSSKSSDSRLSHGFSKSLNGKVIDLVIWPSDFKDQLCYVSVGIR